MSDEFDFKNFKTMEEFSKTLEGTKYLHDLYLKAVNHPIRREILNIVNEGKISKENLFNRLKEGNILDDEGVLKYNIDYLLKAFCVKEIEDDDKTFYEITQSGEVVDYLK